MSGLATSSACPCCASSASRQFYEVRGVPVHQVKLVRSREEARACASGDIALRFCTACGFVWNAAFDPALMRYEEDYESTQAVSPTFNRFHEGLARQLIGRFDLRGKDIVEIGCGQGEFITMLAELGGNRGFGFDQVIRRMAAKRGVTFVKDFYGPRYRHLEPSFVCCKMTLEHVHDTAALVRNVRETLGDRPETIVFFMIPEITRILDLRAFWDIYYEHCSYFSPGSLARLFRTAGFDPIDVWTDYDDQYVLIAARPGSGTGPQLANELSPQALEAKVRAFSTGVLEDQARWKGWIGRLNRGGQKTVLWGGGSKAVAFLTTLGVHDEIQYAVDINPRRTGTFIAGTGQQIVAPGFLKEHRPDVVLIMSPIYLAEITSELEALGVRPARLFTVESGEALRAA